MVNRKSHMCSHVTTCGRVKLRHERASAAVCCCVSSRSDVVISWAAKLLPQSLFVMYEQIHPHDPFGSIMQDHFHKLNSTLHALRQYPDTAAQRRRFLDKVSMQTCP